MIIKFYELSKLKAESINFFLMYGKNEGLQNDIIEKHFIKDFNGQIDKYDEIDFITQSDNIIEGFLNKSLFATKKIVIISRVTDKILKIIENIIEKNLIDTQIILKSGLLEKKSKLRNLFEKNKKLITIPFYEDDTKNLSEAQNNKYQKLIDLIKPNNGDKVLEIGCGWGGFAEFLGKKYDVKLDCITISKKQFDYAKERIFKCGLNEKVNIEIKDYRDLNEKYNSIASIEMIEAVGQNYLEGYFKIPGVVVGRHQIMISSVGYEGKTIPNVQVTTGKEVVLEIELIEALVEMEAVQVVASQKEKGQVRNDMATVSAISLSVEELSRYAATFDDPARAALSQAGVATGGDDLLNEIVIRGNSPKGMLWRLEGVEIPNPNHFGSIGSSAGGISMLSSNMLSNSDFFTGAFPAQYGNATSGIFDLNLRKGNFDQYEHSFQAGLLGIAATSEGPISKNSNSSYLINYSLSIDN